MVDAVQYKAILNQLDFIGAFLQGKVNNRVFVKLDGKYAEYFPEYSRYFGRNLILLKYMNGMNNSGKLFSNEVIKLFIEAVFIQYQYQMSIYYKFAPTGKKLLFYLMLIILFIGLHLKLLGNGFGKSRREIPYEVPGILVLFISIWI